VDTTKGVVRFGIAALATVLVLTGLLGAATLTGTRAQAQPAGDISTHRRWLEAIDRGDVGAAMALFTADAVFDDGGACSFPFMCVEPDEVRAQIEALVKSRVQFSGVLIRKFSTTWTSWTTARFEARSEAVRAAGVERIRQATTVTLRGDKIVSATWRSDEDDAQTTKFLEAQPAPAPPRRPSPEPAPHGRFIDIGGRKLYLECLGTGSPTVVFEAGLDPVGGASGKTWVGNEPRPRPGRNIHAAVARVTRACTYDRAGIGLSDRGPTPRDGLRAVADLQALLRGAGEQPPYVVVGWSLGGPLAYLFASQYRHQVAGLVLLDPFEGPFGFAERLWAMLPPALAERDRQQMERLLTRWAAPGFREGGWDVRALTDHVQGTPPLADIPVSVLSMGIPYANPYDLAPAAILGPQPGWPEELIEKQEQLRLEIHAGLARRVPRGKHIVVDSSHHLVWRFVPERVTAAVLQVVQTVRAR